MGFQLDFKHWIQDAEENMHLGRTRVSQSVKNFGSFWATIAKNGEGKLFPF